MGSILKLRLLRLKDDIWIYVLMMVMAFGLTIVFGISFDEYRPTVLIVDESRSAYSQEMKSDLEGNGVFHFIESDMDQAVVQVREGKAMAAVVIGERFDAEISKGDSVNIGIIRLKEDVLLLSLREQLTGIVSKMAGAARISDITADYIAAAAPIVDREMVKQSAYQGVIEAWTYKNPLEISSVAADLGTSNNNDNLKHSMIGFSLFFSMYTMVFGIGTILYDRQYKTWQRMLITPVSRSAILGGSMIVTFLTGILQLGILIFAGKYLLQIDWGESFLGIMSVAAAFVFSVTALGLLLSGLVKTQAQLSSVSPVVLTSTSMLGGCMWPLDIVNNKVLLFLAELTPQKWALQGMENIASRGMGIEAAFQPTMVLLLMGAIFFLGGVKLVRSFD